MEVEGFPSRLGQGTKFGWRPAVPTYRKGSNSVNLSYFLGIGSVYSVAFAKKV